MQSRITMNILPLYGIYYSKLLYRKYFMKKIEHCILKHYKMIIQTTYVKTKLQLPGLMTPQTYPIPKNYYVFLLTSFINALSYEYIKSIYLAMSIMTDLNSIDTQQPQIT